MWVMTRYGFYSAVQAKADGKRGKRSKGDPSRVVVRARRREHLEALIGRFPTQLGEAEILTSQLTDYACRIVVPTEIWVYVLGTLAAESSEYGNFKDEVHRFKGEDDPKYLAALHRVWSVMYAIQDQHEGEDEDPDETPLAPYTPRGGMRGY